MVFRVGFWAGRLLFLLPLEEPLADAARSCVVVWRRFGGPDVLFGRLEESPVFKFFDERCDWRGLRRGREEVECEDVDREERERVGVRVVFLVCARPREWVERCNFC